MCVFVISNYLSPLLDLDLSECAAFTPVCYFHLASNGNLALVSDTCGLQEVLTCCHSKTRLVEQISMTHVTCALAFQHADYMSCNELLQLSLHILVSDFIHKRNSENNLFHSSLSDLKFMKQSSSPHLDLVSHHCQDRTHCSSDFSY